MTNTLLTVVVSSVVEGITEFLPVSSTGHLLLTEKIMKQHLSDLFNIIIQSAAVLAVIPLFRNRLSQIIFNWRERESFLYAAKLALAFVITGIGGLIITKLGFKLPEDIKPVAVAFLVGGVAFVVVEAWIKGRPRTDNVTWKVAVAVGLAQLVAAVFPGASRSGTSILFVLLLGMARPAATEFSFLVGVPTMLAAGGYELLKAVHHPTLGATHEPWSLIGLGCVISAIVSFVVVKWLLNYVRSHTFTAFGVYRIILAGVIFAAMLTGHL